MPAPQARRSRVSRNAVINAAGNVLPLCVALVTVPIYLRAIGAARYGILALLWLTQNYCGSLVIGLGRTSAHEMARTACAGTRSRIYWTLLGATLCISSTLALLLAFGGSVLAGHLHRSPALLAELRGALPWFVLAIPVIVADSVSTGALDGRESFAVVNALECLGILLFQLAPLAVALLHGPWLPGLVAAAMLARLFTSSLFLAACARIVPLRAPGVDLWRLPALLSYGGLVSATGMLDFLLVSSDRFVIGALLGAESVAYYTIPFNLAQRPGIIPGAITRALFPRFSSTAAADALDLGRRSMTALVALMTPVTMVTLLAMRPFLRWWVGPHIAAISSTTGQILAIAIWMYAATYVPSTYLQGRRRPDLPLKFQLLELVPYFSLLWFGLHRWGIAGAAAAWLMRVTLDTALLTAAAAFGWAYLVRLLPSLLLVLATLAVAQLPFAQSMVAAAMAATIAVTLALANVRLFLPDLFRWALREIAALRRLRPVPGPEPAFDLGETLPR